MAYASKFLSPTLHLFTRTEGVKHTIIRSAFLDHYLKDVEPYLEIRTVGSGLKHKREGENTTNSTVSVVMKPEAILNKMLAKDGLEKGDTILMNSTIEKSEAYKMNSLNGFGKKYLSTIQLQKTVTKIRNPISEAISTTAIKKPFFDTLVRTSPMSFPMTPSTNTKTSIPEQVNPSIWARNTPNVITTTVSPLEPSSSSTTQPLSLSLLLSNHNPPIHPYPNNLPFHPYPPTLTTSTSTSPSKRPRLSKSTSTPYPSTSEESTFTYQPPTPTNPSPKTRLHILGLGLGLGLVTVLLAGNLVFGNLQGEVTESGLENEMRERKGKGGNENESVGKGRGRSLCWDEIWTFGLF